MLDDKPLWYRILWQEGWRPRLFRALQEIAGLFQFPFGPVGFVTWGDYDGDFHLSIGDRDITIDWRGRLVASGTRVESSWAITSNKFMPRSQQHHYAHTEGEN